MDVVSKEKRSKMMSGIRYKDTKPELLIRKGLHKLGYRYRINNRLFGKPDIALKKYNAVIFIHGCFWHGHIGCKNFKIPKSNSKFWIDKIDKNRKRDGEVLNYLRATGWRICIVWECAIRGKFQMENFDNTILNISNWLNSENIWIEITSEKYQISN